MIVELHVILVTLAIFYLVQLVSYVNETAQQLNGRFGKHRNCFKGKMNSVLCKRLSNHFSKSFCKDSGFTVQNIEKWKGRERTGRGIRACGVAVLRKETECMLKLRAVYPYRLNNRIEDKYD